MSRRKNDFTFKTLLVLLTFLFITTLFAQNEEAPAFLTMEEAITRALALNNQIRSSEFSLKKATWDKRQAWTQLFPKVSFNTSYTWIDDSTFALRDFSRYFQDPNSGISIPQTVFQESYFSSINVSMPLFDGRLLNGLSIANINEDMAMEMNESTRNNIIFIAIRSYLDVLKAKETLRLQEDYLELSSLNYNKAERLYKAGRSSKTEALRWKVELQKQKSVVVNSQSTLRSSRAGLNRVLNIEMNHYLQTEQHITDKIQAENDKLLTQNDEELIKLGNLSQDELINANAALKAGKLGEEISQLQYRDTYAAFTPDISLNYTYAWQENNTIELDDYSPQTLMINFSFPVFNSFQDYTKLKSTYYDYKKNQEDFADQLQNTRYIITETINKVINQKTQIELSRLNVDYTEANYKTVEKQKEKGLISNIDFIDAKLNMQNARLEVINNQYDFISSMVELYYLIGKLETLIK